MKNITDENFYDLVEQYLDLELIKEKFDSDELSDECSSSLSDSPFSTNDAISINDFVNNFLNISVESVDAKNLYHCGLKQLKCPYVVGVSNEFANKNPEYVKLGYLLLVIDAHRNRGTYLNPVYLHQLLEMEIVEQELNRLKKLGVNHSEEFSTEYILLKSRLETDKKFLEILKSQKKLLKIKSIKRYEGIGE